MMIQDTVQKIKASIVGCGRISSTFEDTLDTQKPHSHAGAYSSHPEVDLVSASKLDALLNISLNFSFVGLFSDNSLV